jgi:hypothetical protein
VGFGFWGRSLWVCLGFSFVALSALGGFCALGLGPCGFFVGFFLFWVSFFSF